MTGQTQTDPFAAWAKAALEQYELKAPLAIAFLGHSDNITYRVEEPDGARYLLRLHRPALNYWAGIRQLPDVIGSELTWLETLAMEGGFAVQRPVRTRKGEMVAAVAVENEAAPEPAAPKPAPLPATLLTWLEGEHFSASSENASAQIRRLGSLVARMHRFAATWSPPAGFIRPQYDLDHFKRIYARLLRGVDLGVFSEEVYWSLRAASQVILNQIEALPVNPQCWGMVHADLHVGNFLVDSGARSIIPIDFSFCGFGHYLFDVSVCLAGGLKPSLAPAFLSGYRGVLPLPEEDLRAVEAYALTGRLSYYAYQIDNPSEKAWLQRRIPEVAQNQVKRFLGGQRILWDL